MIIAVSAYPPVERVEEIKPRGDTEFNLRDSVTGQFKINTFSGFQWISDSEFLYRKGDDIYTYNVADSSDTIFVTGVQLV